eukprot:9401312-Pyramimonas_sp.AAC.1
MTSFYGSSCANNGKDALNTPDLFPTHVHENAFLSQQRTAALYRELVRILRGWKDLPSVAAAAAGTATWTTSRRSGDEATASCRNAGAGPAGCHPGGHSGPAGAEEEDDVMMTGEKSFEEVLEERKQRAILTGEEYSVDVGA